MAGKHTGRRLYGSDVQDAPGERRIAALIPWAPLSPTRGESTGPKILAEGDEGRRLYGVPLVTEQEDAKRGKGLPTTVVVVDDHPIVRDGIVALLESQCDIQVVGQASNGKEALDMVHQLSPDVVLMDLLMPVMNGLEATALIRAGDSPAKVLVLSQYDDKPNVTACAEAGASGFIPKTNAGQVLVAGIRSVSQGE